MNVKGIETIKEYILDSLEENALTEWHVKFWYPDGTTVVVDVARFCVFDEGGNMQYEEGIIDLRHVSRVEW